MGLAKRSVSSRFALSRSSVEPEHHRLSHEHLDERHVPVVLGGIGFDDLGAEGREDARERVVPGVAAATAEHDLLAVEVAARRPEHRVGAHVARPGRHGLRHGRHGGRLERRDVHQARAVAEGRPDAPDDVDGGGDGHGDDDEIGVPRDVFGGAAFAEARRLHDVAGVAEGACEERAHAGGAAHDADGEAGGLDLEVTLPAARAKDPGRRRARRPRRARARSHAPSTRRGARAPGRGRRAGSRDPV